MLIPLKDPLPILTITELRQEAERQTARSVRFRKLIEDAQAKIDRLRNDAKTVPHGLTGSAAQQVRQIQAGATAPKIAAIREETDQTAVPLLKEMIAASDDAKLRAERHYDKFSLLRRAVKGGGDSPKDAKFLRAAYAKILRATGSVELARWAQDAIDLQDAVLADAVLRENSARKGSDRPFNNSDLMDKITIEEFDQAQLSTNAIISAAAEAGVRWSEFERGQPNTLARLSLGLAARREAQRVAATGAK